MKSTLKKTRLFLLFFQNRKTLMSNEQRNNMGPIMARLNDDYRVKFFVILFSFQAATPEIQAIR